MNFGIKNEMDFIFHPVTKKMNNPRFNSASCIDDISDIQIY